MRRIESRFPSVAAPEAKRVVLTVDSRSRENKENTTASDYVVRFPNLGQIIYARLLSAEIPNCQYVINSKNNVIDLKDGSGSYVVTITPGTYTALSLADEVNLQLNAALGLAPDVNFTVTYITATQKMRITRVLGGTFDLLFKTGPTASRSIGRNLGFLNDYVGVTSVSSERIVDLAGENFVLLVIDRFDGLQNTESIRDVFAKIIWNSPPRFVCYDSFVSNAIYFREPLQNLDRLRVRFIQQDGTLYDFNGLDHSFSIELYVNTTR